ncbi:hypothetical protein P153DRAFT_435730, partial [Dothidotthia symphoricarpi CBS 119687]
MSSNIDSAADQVGISPNYAMPKTHAVLLDSNAILKIENARLKREIEIVRTNIKNTTKDHDDHRQMHDAVVAQFQNRLQLEKDEVKIQRRERDKVEEDCRSLRAEVHKLQVHQIDSNIAAKQEANRFKGLVVHMQPEDQTMEPKKEKEEPSTCARSLSPSELSRSMQELNLAPTRKESIAKMENEVAKMKETRLREIEDEVAKLKGDATDAINIEKDNARHDIRMVQQEKKDFQEEKKNFQQEKKDFQQEKKDFQQEKERIRNTASSTTPTTNPSPPPTAIVPIFPALVQYLDARNASRIDRSTPAGHQQSYDELYSEFKRFTEDLIAFIYYFHREIEERFPKPPATVYARFEIKFNADGEPYNILPRDIGFDIAYLGELCEKYRQQVEWQIRNVADPEKRMRGLEEMYEEFKGSNGTNEEL